MKSFQVKVCGMTTIRDAVLAQQLGATLIGQIFVEDSPRKVTLRQAKEIVTHLSPLCRAVGVFRNQSADEVLRISDRLHLQIVQLHGSFTSRMLTTIKAEGRTIILARDPVARLADSSGLLRAADLLLFDNKGGGSGEAFDWSVKLPAAGKPFGIAGGLSVDNIATALSRFQPDFVDVNSGVESAPGKKSQRKLRAFMQLCHRIRHAGS